MLKSIINMCGLIGQNTFSKFTIRTLNFSDMVSIYSNRLVWIDMEMTGLDINKDKILEVACLVTDSELNIIAEGPQLIIHQPDSVLSNMNEWCVKQHAKTGLTQASRTSTVFVDQAENMILEFISSYVAKQSSPLAGNSVYMDRLFLRKFMPKVDDYLHYRIVDVSTIKELCRLWNVFLYNTVPKKTFQHRALSDIKESVNELKFYRQHFFKQSS